MHQSQKAFNLSDFNLFGSLASPLARSEHLRTCCDLMNAFFIIEEYTDTADVKTVQDIASIVMGRFTQPSRTS
ncbi:hypothetical protein EUX98_g5665 [Antrodiella citrinella]|uniref:Uncharacterized protein n=1 Tax=Antrodiella citrinella TaxID=2447956 RepID=A0A4S4MR05_9APHY|nr:hypothetical protein EUX98_g5665 [Antrodiella citrinella]